MPTFQTAYEYVLPDGRELVVRESDRDAFSAAHPDAERFGRFRSPDGREYKVRERDADAFSAAHPEAAGLAAWDDGSGRVRRGTVADARAAFAAAVPEGPGLLDLAGRYAGAALRGAGEGLAAIPSGLYKGVEGALGALGRAAQRSLGADDAAAELRSDTLQDYRTLSFEDQQRLGRSRQTRIDTSSADEINRRIDEAERLGEWAARREAQAAPGAYSTGAAGAVERVAANAGALAPILAAGLASPLAAAGLDFATRYGQGQDPAAAALAAAAWAAPVRLPEARTVAGGIVRGAADAAARTTASDVLAEGRLSDASELGAAAAVGGLFSAPGAVRGAQAARAALRSGRVAMPGAPEGATVSPASLAATPELRGPAAERLGLAGERAGVVQAGIEADALRAWEAGGRRGPRPATAFVGMPPAPGEGGRIVRPAYAPDGRGDFAPVRRVGAAGGEIPEAVPPEAPPPRAGAEAPRPRAATVVNAYATDATPALPPPSEPGAAPTVYGGRVIVPPYYGPTVSANGAIALPDSEELEARRENRRTLELMDEAERFDSARTRAYTARRNAEVVERVRARREAAAAEAERSARDAARNRASVEAADARSARVGEIYSDFVEFVDRYHPGVGDDRAFMERNAALFERLEAGLRANNPQEVLEATNAIRKRLRGRPSDRPPEPPGRPGGRRPPAPPEPPAAPPSPQEPPRLPGPGPEPPPLPPPPARTALLPPAPEQGRGERPAPPRIEEPVVPPAPAPEQGRRDAGTQGRAPEPARAPWADAVPAPAPDSPEAVVRARVEAFNKLPLTQRLKRASFDEYSRQFPERAGVIDAIGWEKFRTLWRKHKGDFRNVTGDLIDASEVGGIAGRDYSGPDGVRRALQDAADEYAGYLRWKEEGAPTAEEEASTGQLAAYNRAANAEAEAETRRRWELAHPEAAGEPPLTEGEVRDAAAAAEEGEVARIEAEAIAEEPPAPEQGRGDAGTQGPPAVPVAESAAAPRRVTGRPRELSTMHENGNSTTLATVKNRAEKGVLPVEIVVRPNGMGVSRAGQFDANEPVVLFRYEGEGTDSLGHPVFGNTERILDWAKASGLADRAGVSTVESAPVAESAAAPREATIAEKAEAVPWDTRDFFSWTANAFHTPEEANEAFGKVIEEMAKREVSYAQAAAEVTNYTRYKTDALADRITDLAKAGIQIHQLVEEARAKLPPKEPDTVRQGWNAELYRLSDAKAELDRHKPGGREYKAHLRRYERQTEDILDRMAELSPALKDVLTARRALEQALDAAEKKKDADEEWRAINDLAERARHYQQKAISKGPGITFEEIEEPGYPLPGRGKAAEREPFALDGGTPAEIDAEKARAAQSALRRELEAKAEAPGADLGTVTVNPSLPGIETGDLFTPATPARAPSGSVRGDPAAAAPRDAAGAPAPEARAVKPATPDAPRAELRAEYEALAARGDATPEQFSELAARAEAADAFATAALARRRAGTYEGSPQGDDLGVWPRAQPPAARASMGDLVALAKALGDGRVPGVARAISRRPWAAGVFRSVEGDPSSGSVEQTTRGFRLVPDAEAAAIRARAEAQAREEGGTREEVAARTDELARDMLVRASRQAAFDGPKEAQAVLAHEIGHWIDFLDEGTLRRGNVFGHLAALKKYMGRTLFPTKDAADAAGAPGVTQALVRERAREWGVSQAEARRRLTEGADLARLPDLRRQMESLVAWYRQTDGAEPYFRDSPSELYAEAFSAWINYPAETAARAPAFADLLEGWISARPEAARALQEFRDGVTQAEARAAAAAGDTTNPAFFAALDQENAAARRAEELADRLTDEALANRTFGGRANDAWQKYRLAVTGGDNIMKSALLASPDGAFSEGNLPLWRALQQKDNANNRMVLWDYRFRTFVAPLLEGVPRPTFLNYLFHYRVANELLGPNLERGRMNLPNANGLTPGDATRTEGNAQTSSAAWLNELRRTQPDAAARCEAARKAFWEKVRNGGDELGGDGSPMQVVRDSPCLSQAQKDAILGNAPYVAFRPAVVPDVSRPVSRGAMSTWDGMFSQRTGSFKPVGDVLANTFLQDLTLQDQLLQQEYRLRTVDWLRAKGSPWIGPQVEAERAADGRLSVPQREKTGWRVVAFLRDGKPEGWWVRDFLADALAPKPRQRGALSGVRDAVDASARGLNALKTTMNPSFGAANALKDAFSIALRQLPRDTSGVGQAQALVNGLANWFGDYGAMIRSFRDTSAADLTHGKWNANVARALAWGALNNAAPGKSAYSGGGVSDIAARYRAEGRTEISDADLRRVLKTFGYTEEQLSAALDSTEAPLVRVLREVERVTGARWALGIHSELMGFLSRREIDTKSFSLAESLRRNPGLTREERVQWVHDMIGTPAMNNRPAVAKLPGIGHVLPFLTPRVHGWSDQLFGSLRAGWTGGYGRSAQVASRIAVVAALMATPLAAVKILRGEAKEAEERGDAAEAARLRAMARRWMAIPSTDLLTGICFPNPFDEDHHLKIPVDPTILPLTSLVMQAVDSAFGPRDLAKGAGMEQFTGDLLPTLGTVPTVYLGNRSGRDPNTGRAVWGERTPGLDQALWNWDQLTARGLGMLPGSMLRAWMTGSDDVRESERAGRAEKIPFVSALWRPFYRKSGYGLVERANAIRAEEAENGRRLQDIAERIAAGREVSDEDRAWFEANASNPRQSVRAAERRLQDIATMEPDRRALEGVPRRRREAVAERAGYVAP